LIGAPGNRAIADNSDIQGVRLTRRIGRKAGCNGVVGLDVAEGVTGDSAYRDAVDQDVTDMVTAIGGDGEGLVGALVDGNCPLGLMVRLCRHWP